MLGTTTERLRVPSPFDRAMGLDDLRNIADDTQVKKLVYLQQLPLDLASTASLKKFKSVFSRFLV